MAFMNLSLLGGLLLIGIPIVLHLSMRRRPKHLMFPAIRFLQQRRQSNQQRLRLRHWLLLCMRCLAIALLAAALARPSVASALLGDWILAGLLGGLGALALAVLIASVVGKRSKALVIVTASIAAILLIGSLGLIGRALYRGQGVAVGGSEAPVAAVMAFDTSARMLYRSENKTRLEQAQETAQLLLRRLPAESEAAVIGSRSPRAVFSVDLVAAKTSIEKLKTAGAAQALPRVLLKALDLLDESKKKQKEIYVFTDLTLAAWNDETLELKRRLENRRDVSIYLIDIGVQQPQNVSLGSLKLSSQQLAKNGEFTIRTELSSLGIEGDRTIELHLEKPDPQRPVIIDGQMQLPEASQRDGQTVAATPGQASKIQLHLRGLELGVHQGFVKIAGGDALAADDIRYFTIEVSDVWPILAATGVSVDVHPFTEAIAPEEFRQTGKTRYRVDEISQSDLANQQLSNYAAVCLLDPGPIPPAQWERLVKYVEGGGGLAIFLGHNAQSVGSFRDERARQLLGGRLDRIWRGGGRDLYLSPQNYDHPVMREFRSIATSVPWNRFPVFRHWGLDEFSAESQTVLSYGNGQAAILEKPLGAGNVITMTTPITEPARPLGRASWNELASGENAWPRFVIVNQIVEHLVGGGETKLNYLAGEPAALANNESQDPIRYQLFNPLGQMQEVASRDGRVFVRFTEHPGAYRLKGNRGGIVVRGFSVNLKPEATQLARIDETLLEKTFGAGRYKLAREIEEIQRGVGQARAGLEFYPFLMFLLAVMAAMELTLSNRFYRNDG